MASEFNYTSIGQKLGLSKNKILVIWVTESLENCHGIHKFSSPNTG
ncbi:hypothetical protein OSCI_3310035 [Kamptonema sp. PCC 6506]|nr:hypothetical protein OSCI_3310035 [Kamptonema sp. PCC 6506]